MDLLDVLRVFFRKVVTLFDEVLVVFVYVVQVLGEGGGHGGFIEARGVGRGLGAELGEVKIGAGTIADVHRLVEAALRAEPVENDGVEAYGDDLDDDFDESADEGPVLWGMLAKFGAEMIVAERT